jgi:hypothetical protein
MPDKTNITEILAPISSGLVSPGSESGQSLIRDALLIDPERTADLMRKIDKGALREGMRGLGFPDSQVSELLRAPDPSEPGVWNPFTAGSGESGPTPFEDPSLQIERGPVPPWAR